jgi:hypothetical protein
MTTIVVVHQEVATAHVAMVEAIVIEALHVVVVTTKMIAEGTDLLQELVVHLWMTTDHQEDVTRTHTVVTSHLIHMLPEVLHMIVHHQEIILQEMDHIPVRSIAVGTKSVDLNGLKLVNEV